MFCKHHSSVEVSLILQPSLTYKISYLLQHCRSMPLTCYLPSRMQCVLQWHKWIIVTVQAIYLREELVESVQVYVMKYWPYENWSNFQIITNNIKRQIKSSPCLEVRLWGNETVWLSFLVTVFSSCSFHSDMHESTVLGHLVKWWIYTNYWTGIYKAKKCCCILVTRCLQLI